MIAWMIAQVNSRKKLSTEDITKFYWEKAQAEEHETAITKEDIERLRNKAEKYLQTINGRCSN